MKKIFYLLLSIILISGCSVNQETATLNVTVEGNGTVVAYPKTGEIPLGETLLLIPKPENGWTFHEWTKNGNKLTDKDELVFILDGDCSINAEFIQQAEENASLNYRLEASWSSFSASDSLLRMKAQAATESNSRAVSLENEPASFKTADYLSSEPIKRERAILIKYDSKSASSLDEINSFSLGKNTIDPANALSSNLSYVRMVISEDEYDSIDEILQGLRATEGVEYAEEDCLYQVHAAPNDPFYSFQWNMDMLKMPAVWDVAAGSDEVIVAVIDTGAYFLLDDLENTSFVQGYDFVNRYPNAFDDNGHGTHVAGTIAQSTNNNYGVAGIASNVKIMPVKVLAYDGYGYTSDVAQGIIFAANNGADIINMSLGGGYSSLIEDACKYASDHDVLIVASAGNSGTSTISYPAAFADVISVGAVNDLKNITYYSSYGPGLDVMAPGGDFTRTLYNPEFSRTYPGAILQETFDSIEGEAFMFYSGTSMAAPHVTGLAALIKSRNPAATALQIQDIILSTAEDLYTEGYDTYYGYGLIDPIKALGITPYPRNDIVNSSIEQIPGMEQKWRISASESPIQIKLNYMPPEEDKLVFRLEKPDGTVLKEDSSNNGSVSFAYEVTEDQAGELYLTIAIED